MVGLWNARLRAWWVRANVYSTDPTAAARFDTYCAALGVAHYLRKLGDDVKPRMIG